MQQADLDRLRVPLMVENNLTYLKTAFTISIDAAKGITTGVSASNRAKTILDAISPQSTHKDIVMPGHVFPLRAKTGGVLVRGGHTEGSTDLAQLAGLIPSAVICEIMNDDGSMARLPDLIEFAKIHQLKIVSINDIIAYRMKIVNI